MQNRQSTGIDILEPPTEQRPDTRTRILDVAERLFRLMGYTKTTVADIARELDMSPANVYRFFESKSAIHQGLVDRMVSDVEIGALKIARLPLPASERLKMFVIEKHKQTVATLLDDKKVHEMVSVALDEQWPVIERHLDRVTDIIGMVIKEGIASGEFANRDPDIMARCFFASVISVCHPQVVAQCLQKPRRATPEQLAEFAIRALKA